MTIQGQILDIIKNLQKKNQTSVIMITHDLGVVANIAQKIAVMYSGIIVESGTCEDIFYRPRHPYTWALIRSVPRLDLKNKQELATIPGTPPDLLNPPVDVRSARGAAIVCRSVRKRCRRQRNSAASIKLPAGSITRWHQK